MEATRDWSAIEELLRKLFPFAREFDDIVKNGVLDAVLEVTERTRWGMPVSVAKAVSSVLEEMMPVGFGGMLYPSRKKAAKSEQQLLSRIEHRAFELTWDGCRYVRDMKLIEECARVLIRFGRLNHLEESRIQCLENVRACMRICSEERGGKPFAEARKRLDEMIKDALDLPHPRQKA